MKLALDISRYGMNSIRMTTEHGPIANRMFDVQLTTVSSMTSVDAAQASMRAMDYRMSFNISGHSLLELSFVISF